MRLDEFQLDIKHALSQKPPELDHVLPGLLAGTVGVVVAPGATGKTTLLTQLACDISVGLPVGGDIFGACRLNPSGARVAMFLAEESQSIMHHRLQAALEGMQGMEEFRVQSACREVARRLTQNLRLYAMAGAGRIHCVDDVGSTTAEFRLMLEASEGARLVIVDPLRRFHGGEENDSSHMSAVVAAFESIAKKTGAAVVLSHHANRSSVQNGAGGQAGASRGSSALTDGSRWQANLSSLSQHMARIYHVTDAESRHFVQLDIAKANYTSVTEPLVLRRSTSSGVLSVYEINAEGQRKGRTRVTRSSRREAEKEASQQ
jgi:RecA-family ATPase